VCRSHLQGGDTRVMDILVGIVGVLLIGYLLVSIFKPEKF
jgi:K+-transporting ATPase KdpF subunit